ncbi:TonB-dependent receptor [Ideonella dechloratans]|uniref:TonB-dependent receptor n=1 Tax=Ideonella dechloratans TaxID=36863 RepID=UPI0035B1F3C8
MATATPWGVALLSLPLALHAQTAPQNAGTTLPTVSITANQTSPLKVDESSNSKATAPLLDTPKTVNVIPAAVIQQTGAVSMVEALRTVPGISFGGGEGGNPLGDRPIIRGFDSQSSTYIDGLRDIAPSTREVFNLESIEVDKGPDSAFGGRGTAGGSINLYSKRPQTGNFAAGSVGVGTDNYLRVTADGNWQFDEHSAARLNLLSHKNDIPERDGPRNTRWGVAPSIAFGLGTPTRVVLSYYHLQTDDIPDGGIGYNLPSTSSLPSSGVVKLHPDYGGDRTNWYGLFGRDFRKDKTDSGTIQIEHDLGDNLQLRNVTRVAHNSMNYVWTQPDDSQGNIARGMVWRRFNSSIRSVDVVGNATELSGKADAAGFKHSFVVGLELDREQAHNNSYVVSGINYASPYNKCPNGTGEASSYVCTSLSDPNPNDPWLGTLTPNPAGSTDITTNTVSLYATDTVEVNEQWKLNGGLRYDRYRTTQIAAPATVDGVANVRLQYKQNDDLFNGQLGVIYKPASNGSIYLMAGTSSTPAGSSTGQGLETQAITLSNSNDLAPEKNLSYELGTKWDLWDNQLSVSAAVFKMKTQNVRIANSDGTTTDAGDKDTKGFELSAQGKLTRDWEVMAGYTFTRAIGTNVGVTNVGTTASPNWVPAAATGRQFISTPRHSFSLWSTYQLTSDLNLGAGLFGQSDVVGGYAYASGTNGQTLIERTVPGYVRLDAMANYRFNKNINVQLNVQNLTNRMYYTTASSPHYAIQGAGRSAVLSANFKY